MSSKERILAEINQLSENDLQALQHWLQSRNSPEPAKGNLSFFERLRKIRIDAPPDFGENFNQYRFGEKRVEDPH